MVRFSAILIASVLVAFPSLFVVGGCRETTEVCPTVTNISGDLRRWSGDPFPTVDLTGGQPLVVGPQSFKLRFEFSAPPSQTWVPDSSWLHEHLSVKARESSYTTELSQDQLVLSFGEGPPGESLTVILSGVSGPDQAEVVTVVVSRVEPPTARLEVRTEDAEGVWRAVSYGECLPQSPLELRIVFSEAMDRASVEAGLGSGSWSDDEDLEGAPKWEDDRTLLLRCREDAGGVRVRLYDARSLDGVSMEDTALPVVFNSEQPVLCAFDPLTGSVETLCPVPVDIYDAVLTPDGTALLVDAFLNDTDEMQTIVVDTATGKTPPPGETGSTENSGFPGRGGIGDERASSADLWCSSVSPDGAWRASLIEKPELESAEWIVPRDLRVTNRSTGEVRLAIEDFAGLYYPHHGTGDSEPSPPLWSPDGALVAAVSDLGTGKGEVRVLDLTTGEASTATSLQDLADYPAWDSFTWSPDGRYWSVGHVLIETSPPHTHQVLEFGASSRPFWSPDGRWFARGQEWGMVQVRDMQSGSEQVLENALGCGWDSSGRFYFIRWRAGWDRHVGEWECL